MKLAIPAGLALLALAEIASAQSNVQIRGIVDVGARYDQGVKGGTVVSEGSGQSAANRLTFTGVEDLGGGLKASFVLESGFSIDTGMGANNPPGTPTGAFSFGRTALLALGSKATGFVSMGRQYTPFWAISAGPMNDPFGASWLGGIATLYSSTVRTSNSIGYTYGYGERTTLNPAPRTGLGVSAVWSLSEASSPTPSGSGDQKGIGVSYGLERWWAGYAYHRMRGSNTYISATAPVNDLPILVQQTLGTSYRFDWATFYLSANRGDNKLTGPTGIKRRNWDVAAQVPVTVFQTVRVMYGRANNLAVSNGGFKELQIAYEYDLSKRTYVYAAYGQVDNEAASNATTAGAVGTYAGGTSAKSTIVGVAQQF
jgi:predicted porin